MERMCLNICHHKSLKVNKKLLVPLSLKLLPRYKSEKAICTSLPKRTRTRFKEMVAFLWLNEWNEWKKRKAFFSSADMSIAVWDQASGENHVLQVEDQFFNLACSQQEVLTTVIRILILASKCKINPPNVLFWLRIILLWEKTINCAISHF